MSITARDYFDLAVRNARSEFGVKPPAGQTHWSYYDAPQWALCGERIGPIQFARVPTCLTCLARLHQMQDEDVR